ITFHSNLARVQGTELLGDQIVQVSQACEKLRRTPTGMVQPLHGEELAVDGVVCLIQYRTHCRHLGVREHSVPARFFGLEPVANALAMFFSYRRGDAIGKVTQALAQCHRPQACALSTDRKSTRLNSSHGSISYAVFC